MSRSKACRPRTVSYRASSGTSSNANPEPIVFTQALETLYARRAAVEDLIRSIEHYSGNEELSGPAVTHSAA